jgi:hypothetical protein
VTTVTRQRIAVIAPLLACLVAVIAIAIPMLISNSIVLFVLNFWPGMYGTIAMTVVAVVATRSGIRNGISAVSFMVLTLTAWFWIIALIDITTTPAYVIRNDAVTKMRLSGFGEVPYTMNNGSTVKVSQRSATGCVIINDSPRAARLDELRYSRDARVGGVWNRTPIAAYSAMYFDETIDHLGPDDPPPRSISVVRWSKGTVRRWLTWP